MGGGGELLLIELTVLLVDGLWEEKEGCGERRRDSNRKTETRT